MKNKTIDMFTEYCINDGFPVSLSDKENFVEPYNDKKGLFGIKIYHPIERGYVIILREGEVVIECKDNVTDGEKAYLEGDHTYTNRNLNVSTKTRNIHVGTFIRKFYKNNLVILNLYKKRIVPSRPIAQTGGIRSDR